MGVHAQVIGELVTLCSILGGFYIAVSSCPSNRRISQFVLYFRGIYIMGLHAQIIRVSNFM